MAQEVFLPGDRRFFEIRFESIGGLGAHAAGQIVASAATVILAAGAGKSAAAAIHDDLCK